MDFLIVLRAKEERKRSSRSSEAAILGHVELANEAIALTAVDVVDKGTAVMETVPAARGSAARRRITKASNAPDSAEDPSLAPTPTRTSCNQNIPRISEKSFLA